MTYFTTAIDPTGPLGGYAPMGIEDASDGGTGSSDSYSPGDGNQVVVHLSGEVMFADGLRFYLTRGSTDIRLEDIYVWENTVQSGSVGVGNSDVRANGTKVWSYAGDSMTWGAFTEVVFPRQEVGSISLRFADRAGNGVADTVNVAEVQPHEETMPKHTH